MARAATAAHDPHLRRYLLDGEHIVIAVRQHWGKVAEPVLTAVVTLLLVVWAGVELPQSMGRAADGLWWLWFLVLARTAWLLLAWRADWFLATDNRLLLTYGLITRRVSMMPLSKVTDMSYTRSLPGRIFGWGRFVMESAGQEQALREVNWIPHPDQTYRAICAEIFDVEDHDKVSNDTDVAHLDPPDDDPQVDGRWRRHDDGHPAPQEEYDAEGTRRYPGALGRRPTAVRRGPIVENVPPDLDPTGQQSRAIPIHRPVQDSDDQPSPAPAPTPRPRTGDTGPIPPREWDDPTFL